MRISKFTFLFFAIVSVALAGGCAQTGGSNVNTTSQTVATPAPTPDSAAIVAEITRIEKDWPRILKEKDGASVRRVEADDIVLVYPDGSNGGKEQDVKDIEAGNITYDSWDVSELNVKILDSDAAVASMLITVTGGKYKTPDGRVQDISGHYRGIDTFVRRSGQWQVVASSVVKLSRDAEQSLTATALPSPAASSTPMTKSSPASKPAATRRPTPPPPANQ